MNNNLAVINEQISFEQEIDLETGTITDKYYLPGEYITFNLDGLPFRFEVFCLEVEHQENKILNIYLDVDSEVPENLFILMNVIPYPEEYDNEEINADLYSFRLTLKDDVLETMISPKIKEEKDLELTNLFSLKDESNGQNILTDFFYYKFVSIAGA